jgi:hypothetical protein
MLLASIASVLYELYAGLRVMAHNQYQGRHDLLDTSRQQPDHLSPHLGLTPTELSLCDRYTADAYEQSVYDGYKLGTGYSKLSNLCLGLAALLILTSIAGIRSLASGQVSDQPVQPAATRSAGGEGRPLR